MRSTYDLASQQVSLTKCAGKVISAPHFSEGMSACLKHELMGKLCSEDMPLPEQASSVRVPQNTDVGMHPACPAGLALQPQSGELQA